MTEPQITVIKPAGGFKLPKFNFRLPKSKPAVLIVATVVLAIISVVTALYLYQRRTEPVAPTAPASKPKAASTTTISDNFDGASLDTTKWNISISDQNSSVNQSGGALNFNIPVATQHGYVAPNYKTLVAGDLDASVDVKSFNLNSSAGSKGDVEIKLWADDNNYFNVRWRKDDVGSYVDMVASDNGVYFDSPNSLTIPPESAIKLRIVRVGNVIQGFVTKSGGEQELIASRDFTSSGPFHLQLLLWKQTAGSPDSDISAAMDNFSARVNLSGAVAPTPGTPAACTTSFTVLALSPTPTPGPTPTPTGGPSPTPTPTPTPTPSPTPGAPNDCNGTCGSNANCSSGLFCFDTGAQKYCRNPLNPTSVTCAGTTPAPTPTPTPVALGPTPTPITLEEAGSVAGTWTISLAGGALLLLGTMLMLAL